MIDLWSGISGFISGLLAAMGMGGGAVLIIYLTLFAGVEQIAAQGINLIFFIPIGFTAVLIYALKKKIKWKITIPIALGGIVGAFAGLFLAQVLGSDLISKIFGGFAVMIMPLYFAKSPAKPSSSNLQA